MRLQVEIPDPKNVVLLVVMSGFPIPIPSMYGIFTYICHKFMVNVGKYAIHGWYGIGNTSMVTYSTDDSLFVHVG